jgi:hypothetical protein
MDVSAGDRRVSQGLRRRFWVEAIVGLVTAFLAILTTFWHDWIESVFRVDPDHGNGGLEWAIVVALAICSVVLLAMAFFEWQFTPRPVEELL